jgi:hypothetical protein
MDREDLVGKAGVFKHFIFYVVSRAFVVSSQFEAFVGVILDKEDREYFELLI